MQLALRHFSRRFLEGATGTVLIGTVLIGSLVGGGPALASVQSASDRGFVVREVLTVSADRDQVWQALLRPAGWWNSDHTWSGDAANLSIDPRAGGCFCEVLPNAASPRAAPRGGVEHMRVIYIEQPRVLRMSGALGPLQSDAVVGTLTVELRPAELAAEGDQAGGEGTQILVEYVVGGFLRSPVAKMAAASDAMLQQQFDGLAQTLGGKRKAVGQQPIKIDTDSDLAPSDLPLAPADGSQNAAEEADPAVGNPNLPSGR